MKKNFWLSWYHDKNMSGYGTAFPSWVSGESPRGKMICAAIKAKDENEAWEIVEKSYAERPVVLARGFCQEREKSWSPFSDRFPKADWMVWE